MSGINKLVLFVPLLFLDGAYLDSDGFRKPQPGKPWVPPNPTGLQDYTNKPVTTGKERPFSLLYQTPAPPVATIQDPINQLRGYMCPQAYGNFKYTNRCDEYVQCKNYIPITQTCPTGLRFNPLSRWTENPCSYPSEVQCDEDPVVQIITPVTAAPVVIKPREFTCPQPQGYFKINDKCSEYVECKNYIPRNYVCPAGLYFNPDVHWTDYPCDNPSKVKCTREPNIFIETAITAPATPIVISPVPRFPQQPNYRCPKQYGYFKQTDQCDEYVECKNYVSRTFTCPPGLHFNPRVQWTDYPCDHPSVAACYKEPVIPIRIATITTPAPTVITDVDFLCPRPNGYFKYANQCSKYIECKSYIPRTYTCPGTLQFNPDVEWIDYPCDHSSRVRCE